MCPNEEKVTAWLLEDLPPAEQRAMTAHLASCADCRAVRDELAGVLGPLKSGLEKDRLETPAVVRVAAGRQALPPRSPQKAEWLRRAALFAVSFGTLAASVALVQVLTNRTPPPQGAVTHLTFRNDPEAPVPVLTPVPDAPPAVLSGADDFRPDALAGTGGGRAVDVPALPAGEPPSPRLPGLFTPRDVAAAERAVANAQPAAEAPRLTAAKPQRPERDDTRKVPPPPAGLSMKPVLLAGVAPTNAPAVTNAPPAAPKENGGQR